MGGVEACPCERLCGCVVVSLPLSNVCIGRATERLSLDSELSVIWSKPSRVTQVSRFVQGRRRLFVSGYFGH